MKKIALALLLLFAASARPASNFVLVAHGGAGDYSKMTPQAIEARRAGMLQAVRAGYAILERGGASLDAVEATIRVMEDSGLYDAGRGAYYTREGVPEMDAAIMDGRTLQAGSVAALKHIANPIHLARLVMEKTPHVLLVADGAEEFAKTQGIELVSPYYFYTEREWKRFQDAEKQKEEATHRNSHENRSILRDSPAAPAALGDRDPRVKPGGPSDYAIKACMAGSTQVRYIHVCIMSSNVPAECSVKYEGTFHIRTGQKGPGSCLEPRHIPNPAGRTHPGYAPEIIGCGKAHFRSGWF